MDQQFRILKPRPARIPYAFVYRLWEHTTKDMVGWGTVRADRTRVPQAPPTKSSVEPPLPRRASPGLGRWALDVGAGGSYFHTSPQRPWPLIRQAATMNF